MQVYGLVNTLHMDLPRSGIVSAEIGIYRGKDKWY